MFHSFANVGAVVSVMTLVALYWIWLNPRRAKYRPGNVTAIQAFALTKWSDVILSAPVQLSRPNLSSHNVPTLQMTSSVVRIATRCINISLV